MDYFCKVWVNGKFAGEHEGYSSPFEFEIGGLLERGKKNFVVAKVSSPWDNDVLKGEEHIRTRRRLCGMFKGTYEQSTRGSAVSCIKQLKKIYYKSKEDNLNEKIVI